VAVNGLKFNKYFLAKVDLITGFIVDLYGGWAKQLKGGILPISNRRNESPVFKTRHEMESISGRKRLQEKTTDDVIQPNPSNLWLNQGLKIP